MEVEAASEKRRASTPLGLNEDFEMWPCGETVLRGDLLHALGLFRSFALLREGGLDVDALHEYCQRMGESWSNNFTYPQLCFSSCGLLF
jgi:hypothetical protein